MPGPSSPSRPRARHLLALLTGLALAGAGLVGCGSAETSGAAPAARTSSPSASAPGASASTQTISVRVDGDRVSPRNERVQVRAGQPVRVRVVSDRDGELHVHSSPETTFDFGPGTSTTTFTIARPGLVEMEEHVSDTLVAQLEAR